MNIFRKNARLVLYYSKQIRLKCDYFITTPIYYVNSSPHIGHLYTSLLADASHRFHCMLEEEAKTVFSTGTDEHGTKIQQAADAAQEKLQHFCDGISEEYKLMNAQYDINCTHFIRTTCPEHKKIVQTFWKVLSDKGVISKGTYKGWYCEADESFLADHQINITKDSNGQELRVSAESGRPVNWVEEENYKFHLSKFKADLKHWLNADKSIQPEKFRRQVLHWIDDRGLADEDVSVSRPKSRVHWAVPVPDDESHTVYVWLDALINYLTIGGYPKLRMWPPNVQVIGKDILKFHAIYWPAFLIAADLEPPRTLVVHSHWTVDDEKMSKSKGNVICPFGAIKTYGADGMRYFLLREGTPQSDSNYSDTKLLRVVNSELADTLGNLLSRCCGKTVNQHQTFPIYTEENFNTYCRDQAKDLISIVNSLSEEVGRHYMEFNFYKGIALIMSALREGNRYFEYARPWELRKTNLIHLEASLYLIMETLRVCGLALSPVVPGLAAKLLNKLNIPKDERRWANTLPTWNTREAAKCKIELDREKVILFKRIQL